MKTIGIGTLAVIGFTGYTLCASTFFVQSSGGTDGPPWPFNPQPDAPLTQIGPDSYLVEDGSTSQYGTMSADSIDPTDPGNDSTNAAPNDLGTTNCPCCSYPTNATLKWFLSRGAPNVDWNSCLTLSPDGILYSPSESTQIASPNLAGIQVSNVNTNDPNYPAWDDFIAQSAPGNSAAPVVIAPDGSRIVNVGNTLIDPGTGYPIGFDHLVMSYNTNLASNNWTIDLLSDDDDAGWNGMVVDDAGTIYVPSRTRIFALTNAPGLMSSYVNARYDWANGGFPLPRTTNTFSLNGVGIKWVFSYPDAFMAHTNLLVYPQKYDSGFFKAGPMLANGTIYINTYGGQLFAINATNGAFKWATPFFPETSNCLCAVFPASAPVIGSNGLVYFGMDTAFYAVDPSAPTTNFSMGLKYYYTNWDQVFILNPIIGDDGTVYEESCGNGSYNSAMYNYNNSPGYFGPTDGTTNALFAFSPQLGVKWVDYMSTNTSTEFSIDLYDMGRTGSLALAADGELYLGDWDGTFYSLCAATGSTNYATNVNSMLPNNETDAEMHSPLIAPDGTVYMDAYGAATDNSFIFAFAGPSPLDCRGWPEDRRNNRRTGVASGPQLFAHLSNPQIQTNGFQFTINPVQTNQSPLDCICGSTNLTQWGEVGEVSLTNGPTNFIDMTWTNFPYRFYYAFPD